MLHILVFWGVFAGLARHARLSVLEDMESIGNRRFSGPYESTF